MGTQVARRAFTVDEYHRMIAADILSKDDHVELIDGEIVQMSPIGSRHASCVDRLNALFARKVGRRAIVRVQGPIILGRRSEPQPDVVVLRPRADFYAGGNPGPRDVLLVIEVTDTSGAYDREIKLPLYARAGIPEAWIVDVRREAVEVYRGPALRAYRTRLDLTRGRRLSPIAFPRLAVKVGDILG